MNQNSQAMCATIVGAVIGSAAGYLFFTDRGRALRREIEPALDDFSRELSSLRVTVRKAVGVANEGWNVLNEALGDGSASMRTAPSHATPHQTSPF